MREHVSETARFRRASYGFRNKLLPAESAVICELDSHSTWSLRRLRTYRRDFMTARKMTAVTLWTLLVSFCIAGTSQAATPIIANLYPSFGTTVATVIIYGTNFGSTQGS